MNTQSLIPEIPEFTEAHRQALEVLYDLSTSKNPNLNRLRRCPSSGTYHFCQHGNTDFLTKQIAVEYANRNKSNKKQANEIAEELKNEKEHEGQSEIVNNLAVSFNQLTPKPVNPTEGFKVNEVEKKMLMQELLKKLLGNKSSIELPFKSISSTDFDLNTFDEIKKFPNSNLTYATFGEYTICWLSDNIFKLNTKKQMLWTL